MRAVAAALAATVVVGAVVAGWHTLVRSVSALGQLDLGWFTLAVACECVSLTAFGLSRRRLLRADGHRVGLRSVMAITYAANALSMAVPFAGAELAAVFSYRQFRRRGLDPALTGWALGMSAIASSLALALLLFAGALVSGAPLASAAGLAGSAVFGLPALLVLLAMRYPRARAATSRAVARAVRIARLLPGASKPGASKPGASPPEPETFARKLDAFVARLAGLRLSWRGYAEVFGLALLNWLADCACLACAIRATGSPVPSHALLVAYGAGVAVGSTGLTPGGFGLVEITLTAALTAAGLAAPAALAGVLAYRLVNFWMILLGGGIMLVILARAREHRYGLSRQEFR